MMKVKELAKSLAQVNQESEVVDAKRMAIVKVEGNDLSGSKYTVLHFAEPDKPKESKEVDAEYEVRSKGKR